MEKETKKLLKELRKGYKNVETEKERIETVSKLLTIGATRVSQDKEQTVLILPKKWNWTAFICLSVFLNIFGLIGYMIYYGSKKHGKQVTINRI